MVQVEEVLPGERLPFAWEQVVSGASLDLHVCGRRKRICLDDLRLVGAIDVNAEGEQRETLRYRMATDGPVKVLQIKGGSSSRHGLGRSHSVFDDDGRLRRKLSVSLAVIGVSLVDKTPRELLYMSAAGFALAINETAVRSSVNVTVKQLQVDNQLPGAIFPVMLQPSWVDVEQDQEVPPPAFELLFQINSSARGVYFFETASLRLQTMQLAVDTRLVRCCI